MEQWPVETVDNDDRFALRVVRRALLNRLLDAVLATAATVVVSVALRPRTNARELEIGMTLVVVVFCVGCGTAGTSHLGHTEDRFPSVETGVLVVGGRWESETGRGERAFCPSVVDAGNVPLHLLRACVSVELVADINQVLDRSNIDIVDRGKVQNDSLECRLVLLTLWLLAASRSARVVPRAVAESVITVEVGATGVRKDVFSHVVKVVRRVRVVVAFRKSVHEDSWVR